MRISDWSSDVCSSDLRAGYGIPPIGRYGHQCAVAAKRDARRLPAVHAQYPAQGLRLVAARARQAGLVRDARQAGAGVLSRNLRRSEERRVGKRWVSTCKYWWSATS